MAGARLSVPFAQLVAPPKIHRQNRMFAQRTSSLTYLHLFVAAAAADGGIVVVAASSVVVFAADIV